MNKYTLGTIVGASLLGLAKKNTRGSNIKIKEFFHIEGYIEFQVNVDLTLIKLFNPKYENLVALTEKVWDRLPKTKIEQQSSEQQSSEQQSSEQQYYGAPTYTYTKEGEGRYRILWCDLLITIQEAIGERIEEIIHNNPEFNYPQGWNEDIHSWNANTEMMELYSDDAEDYNEFVNEQKTYFWFTVRIDQTLESQPFPTEETAIQTFENVVGELWDQIWDATFPIIKEEFFAHRMVADYAWNYERDVDFDKYLVIEQSGKWVRYNTPKKTKTKLRKR